VRRFTEAEIATFLDAVARGTKVTEVARKHGFLTSTFRRWALRYGMPHIYHVPTAEEREQASDGVESAR
jgi:hypothetical protein